MKVVPRARQKASIAARSTRLVPRWASSGGIAWRAAQAACLPCTRCQNENTDSSAAANSPSDASPVHAIPSTDPCMQHKQVRQLGHRGEPIPERNRARIHRVRNEMQSILNAITGGDHSSRSVGPWTWAPEPDRPCGSDNPYGTTQYPADTRRRPGLRRRGVLQPGVEGADAAPRPARRRGHELHRCPQPGHRVHAEPLQHADRTHGIPDRRAGRVHRRRRPVPDRGVAPHAAWDVARPGLCHRAVRQVARRPELPGPRRTPDQRKRLRPGGADRLRARHSRCADPPRLRPFLRHGVLPDHRLPVCVYRRRPHPGGTDKAA